MSDSGYFTFMHRLLRSGALPAYIRSVIKTNGEVNPAAKALRERCYISGASEPRPFEGVSFEWGKKQLPDEGEFKNLIGTQSEVKKLEPSKWDARGEYKDVVDAVTMSISGGPVKVYRARESENKVKYFIVGIDRSEDKIVGVKTSAVEPQYRFVNRS